MTKSQFWEEEKSEDIHRQYRASFSNINYKLPNERDSSLESKGETEIIVLTYGVNHRKKILNEQSIGA